MKCNKCGKIIPNDSEFCQYCRAKVTPQQLIVAEKEHRSGVRCPRCGSKDLEIVMDVKSQGVSGSLACCGSVGGCFICGPCGALLGLLGFNGAGEVKTDHLWICKNCAMKFRL